MDPFELLKTDHRKVAQLFDELEAARGSAKIGVFRQIKDELELHTQIEETIFYPALEEPEQTHDLTLEAYEEHKVVKDLLAELGGTSSADDEWQAKAKVLREQVEHHVDEEENDLFDKADDALSDEELESLGDRMAAEKGRRGKPVENTDGAEDKPGIVTRIANFVGLGSKKGGSKAASSRKGAAKASKASKKTAAKKASAAKASKSAKGGGSKKSAASKKSASKKSAGKKSPSKKSAGQNSASKKSASKKSASKKSGAKKASGKGSKSAASSKRGGAKKSAKKGGKKSSRGR